MPDSTFEHKLLPSMRDLPARLDNRGSGDGRTPAPHYTSWKTAEEEMMRKQSAAQSKGTLLRSAVKDAARRSRRGGN